MDGLEAQGTILAIQGPGSPSEYVPIPDCKDVAVRTGSASVNDTTSIVDEARTKRQGIVDEGQCTFLLNFRPKEATHAELVEARADRQAREFSVTFTDESPATVYYFTGYVISAPVIGAANGIMESSMVVEISGEVRDTPAAPITEYTRLATTQGGTLATTHDVNLPEHQTGDVLLVFYSMDRQASTNVTLDTGVSGTGWNNTLVDGLAATGFGGCAWKVAASASEQLRFTTNVGEQLNAIAYSMNNRDVVLVASGGRIASNSAPPCPAGTPGSGLFDWFVGCTSAPPDQTPAVQSEFTGYPAGYGETQAVIGTAGNPSLAVAILRDSPAPETPGDFATSEDGVSMAFTVAVA